MKAVTPLVVSIHVSGGGSCTSWWPAAPAYPTEVDSIGTVVVSVNAPVHTTVTGDILQYKYLET